MKYEVKSYRYAKDYWNYIITIEHIPNWFEKLVGCNQEQVEYYGRFLWCKIPDMNSCNRDLERLLEQTVKKIEYDKNELGKQIPPPIEV